MNSKNLQGAIDFRQTKAIKGNSIYVTIKGETVPIERLKDSIFVRPGTILFKGIMKKIMFKIDLENLIDIIKREGGLTAALFGLSENIYPAKVAADANMSGVTYFHHTTTDINIATEFSVKESLGSYDSTYRCDGVILVIEMQEGRTGIYLPSITDGWDNEKEVSIPGFIYESEIIGTFDIKSGKLNKYWENPEYNGNKVIDIDSYSRQIQSHLDKQKC